MKHIINLFLAVALIATASCSYIQNYDKPHLELSEQSPYTLTITKFSCGYGITEFNHFSGDFDKLDEKVYDALKGKSGSCKVYLEQQGKDNYGNDSHATNYIGDINIDELNKYQDWTYWQKDAGIKTLLYKNINKQ
jgi:hypothetical protein